MRAGIVFFGLLFPAATAAMAQPPAIILPEPSFYQHSTAHLPLSDGSTFQDISRTEANPALARGQMAASGHPLALGPFSMDIGSSDIGRDGKRAHFAHVQFGDFHPLGGNVSGTFDGRAATVRLSWPTGQ
ncbi:MAG TPA: hypothetical protein VMU22_05050 [Rhizomicrobium sp.]|nr:hypothetical protein [Rhizomicrobium sp.]